ncbi:TetR/AcrR family transcriptional regulator [Pseudokineococcus basanitobsidens]|uniref:TetR/AcrR family transcriptional regulator n=1 Tax=Pseudokineococcus basanitobsidens TaxID=1926649 RepID=A0ABU8RLZ9_9ACTN
MTSSDGSPPALRDALLRAAREELDQAGGAPVSLRAVARRAGVSHAAPAYAFGDRSGLLTAVAAEGFAELAALMDRPAPPGREGLAELGRRYTAFARDNPALYEVMFSPGDLDDDDEALDAARASSLRALTRLTRDDGADGPPGELTSIAWAFAHGVASLSTRGALPRATAEALVDGFAALADGRGAGPGHRGPQQRQPAAHR